MNSPHASRRTFLGSSLAALTTPIIRAGAATKRNVLFIASDDLSNRLHCYGHPVVQSPNFDRVGRASVRFDRSYCQYPLCNPSRSSLMTGMAPDTTRVYGNQTHFREALPAAVALPQLFQKAGYFVARVGKIYHYGNPGQIGTGGLDDPPSWQEVVNPAGVDHTKEEPLVTRYTPQRPSLGSTIAFYASQAKDDQHTDHMVADAVIAMMEKHRKEPWFLGAGFYKPHCPWIVPSKYFDLYPLSRIQAPLFEESEMRIAPEWAYFTKPSNWGMTVQQRREAIRAYFAAISFLDAQIGRLLDALEHLGLAQNTTLVFWADHGYNLGEHGQWMKQTLFEPAARVPLFIGGAGVEARGRGCSRTTEHLDVYPTVAELCGLKPPAGLHGRSLMPLLKDPTARWDYPALTQVERRGEGKQVMGYAVRTERYRYTYWNRGAEGEELYDYQEDRRELHNLAHDAASEPLKRKLRARLESIARARGMSAATVAA